MKRFLVCLVAIAAILAFASGAVFAEHRDNFNKGANPHYNYHCEHQRENIPVDGFFGHIANYMINNIMGNRLDGFFGHIANHMVNNIMGNRQQPSIIVHQQTPVVVHQQDCLNCESQQYYYDEQNEDEMHSIPRNAILQKVFRGKTVQVKIYGVKEKAFAEEMVRVNGGKVYYGHGAALILKSEATQNSYDNNHQRITVVARVVCGPNKALVLSGSWSIVYNNNYYSGRQQEYRFRAFTKALQNLH